MSIKQLPMGQDTPVKQGDKRFEQVFHKHRRTCECEIPMLSKKWNEALGDFITIRLCCMAKAVEKLTGERLYEVDQFSPRWVWDCVELHQSEGADGTMEYTERGVPPGWLLERMSKKGIEVKNLPEAHHGQ